MLDMAIGIEMVRALISSRLSLHQIDRVYSQAVFGRVHDRPGDEDARVTSSGSITARTLEMRMPGAMPAEIMLDSVILAWIPTDWPES